MSGGRLRIATRAGRLDWADRSIARGGRRVLLSGDAPFRLVAALASAPGVVPYGDLLDFIWGDDPEGGPVNAVGAIHVMRARLRDRLDRLGLSILTRWGIGFELAVSGRISDRPARPSHRRPAGAALPSLGVSSLDCRLPSGAGGLLGEGSGPRACQGADPRLVSLVSLVPSGAGLPGPGAGFGSA